MLDPVVQGSQPEATQQPAEPAVQNDWRSALPETVLAWDEVKNAKSPEDFYNWVGNMRSHLGQSIRVPSKEAGEEDWKKFNEKLLKHVPDLMPAPKTEEEVKLVLAKLGKPDDPNGYQFENEQYQSQIEGLRALAHEAGLTQSQFKALAESMVKDQEAIAAAARQTHSEAMNALVQEWGLAAERKFAEAASAIEEFFPTMAGVDIKTLDPSVIKGLAAVRAAIGGEGSQVAAQPRNGGEPKLTPAEARERINEVYRNKQHPYWNQNDPGHREWIMKMVELQRAANP